MKRRRVSDGDGGPKHARVQAFLPDEEVAVDVLRIPVVSGFYAFIEKIEIEKTRDHARILHINFDCMDAPWFDRLAEDLSDMPAVDTIAQVAGSCLVEVAIPEAALGQIEHAINVPHIQADWWVKLWMLDQRIDDQCAEAVVYRPAAGSINPVTIGTTGNSEIGWVRWIERVRPPRTLAKLWLFSHNPDI